MRHSDPPPDSASTARDSIVTADNLSAFQDKSSPPGPSPSFNQQEEVNVLERTPTNAREIWKFRLRDTDDADPTDWWFASTAIPLLAATIGPMANVMSIAALVTPWRAAYDSKYPGQDPFTIGYDDPRWCVGLNIASLVCGFVGNLFLLFNFTKRIRYIVALPMTIVLWYFSTGILIATTISMNLYIPPVQPDETYSQGFWYAVIAAVLYLLASMLLMVNMLGYSLGHYPQHFDLSEEQRNLILQTMMFFVWLAGGAGLYGRVCGFAYADALYFCDVSILTVGFGDFYPPNDSGRAIIFPFSVGGIIILGLMVSSIRKFAQELGHDKVIKHHVESRRIRTLERAVTTSFEAEQRYNGEHAFLEKGRRPSISTPFNATKRTVAFDPEEKGDERTSKDPFSPRSLTSLTSPISTFSLSNLSIRPRSITNSFRIGKARARRPKLLILREERDRFNAMRSIQQSTRQFKRYSALMMSVLAFGLLWCVGAVVFWHVESNAQHLTYFQALYFCYVSLLTIGYGDLSPNSNAGKPFFVVWSLVAIPTMTILISDMGDTVVASYKRGTFNVADWTVLPKEGFFREFFEKHPAVMSWIQTRRLRREEKRRLAQGFPTGPQPEAVPALQPTLEELATEDECLDEHDLAQKLTIALRSVATDLASSHDRRYSYEEWVEFTRLIRFSKFSSNAGSRLEAEEEEDGLIEWDWIGENSPMLADKTESEWLLDRLCESLDRYMKGQVPRHVTERRKDRASKSKRRSRGSGGQEDGMRAVGGGRRAENGALLKWSGSGSPGRDFHSLGHMRLGGKR